MLHSQKHSTASKDDVDASRSAIEEMGGDDHWNDDGTGLEVAQYVDVATVHSDDAVHTQPVWDGLCSYA